KAVFHPTAWPIVSVWLVGRPTPSVLCTSNRPHPFPAAMVGVITPPLAPLLYDPVGTLAPRNTVTIKFPCSSLRESNRYLPRKDTSPNPSRAFGLLCSR